MRVEGESVAGRDSLIFTGVLLMKWKRYLAATTRPSFEILYQGTALEWWRYWHRGFLRTDYRPFSSSKGHGTVLDLSYEDRRMLARILEASPGRVGRPPDGDVAMTNAQRRMKHYYAHKRAKEAKALPPIMERPQPDIVPSPQGPAVSGIPFIEEVVSMMARIEMNYAKYAQERLGEILDRIAGASDDARVCDVLSRDEFVLLTAAAIQRMRLTEQIQ